MKFYFVSGEKSGDLHGANLAHEILQQNLMFRDLHQTFGSRGEIVRLQREPTV